MSQKFNRWRVFDIDCCCLFCFIELVSNTFRARITNVAERCFVSAISIIRLHDLLHDIISKCIDCSVEISHLLLTGTSTNGWARRQWSNWDWEDRADSSDSMKMVSKSRIEYIMYSQKEMAKNIGLYPHASRLASIAKFTSFHQFHQ